MTPEQRAEKATKRMKMYPWIGLIRLGLSGILLWFVAQETGLATTLFLVLLIIRLEFEDYINWLKEQRTP